MKKLTLARVVPMISASISWLIFGTTGSGVPSFPKLASRSSTRRQPLFAGIEELVHQVLLNPNVAREQVVQEELGYARVPIDQLDHFRFPQPHNRAIGHCGGRGYPLDLTGQAALAKEIVGRQDGDHRLLPLVRDYSELEFAALDVEDKRPLVHPERIPPGLSGSV